MSEKPSSFSSPISSPLSFPWGRLLQRSIESGLSVNAFWQLTPAELYHILTPPDMAHASMSRSDFDALMRLYPDAAGENKQNNQ